MTEAQALQEELMRLQLKRAEHRKRAFDIEVAIFGYKLNKMKLKVNKRG